MRAHCDTLNRREFFSFIIKCLTNIDPSAVYIPNWHIELIAEYLEAARRGQIQRLIINIPPRSLKSTCVTVAWPAWILGHDPRSRMIAASYAASLSIKHSLDCRLVMESEWYRRIFPDAQLVRGQKEKRKFVTTQCGFRLATSVGGSTTGEGGNFLILDDPVNPLQAMNHRWRTRANEWFSHTFASRLDDKRKGVIVVVMQRLHPQDLSGYLMERGGWQQLVVPAVTEAERIHCFGSIKKLSHAGELLHASREDELLLEKAKIELGSSAFAAQYQQQPIPNDGAMLKMSWIGRYDTAPSICERIVQSWDTAIKSEDKNDASVCITFGEWLGKAYVLDVQAFRCEYPGLKRKFSDSAAQWKPSAILIEDRASGQQLLQDARQETTLPVIAIRPKGSKVVRFAAISALIEAGRLVLPRHAPWLVDFEAEIVSFPHGVHDDRVDALTQYLDWMRKNTRNSMAIRGI